MNIILINNYPMENAYSLWKQAVGGSLHVWDKVEVEKKYDYKFKLFPHVKYPFLNKHWRFIGKGFLDKQLRLVFLSFKDYKIYLPHALPSAKLIILLKVLGLFGNPIVVIIHQPYLGTKFGSRVKRLMASFFLKRDDLVIFPSEKLMKDSVRILKFNRNLVGSTIVLTLCAPDKMLYRPYIKTNRGFDSYKYYMCAGHTDGDYETLIESFRTIYFPLHLFFTNETTPNVKNLAENPLIRRQDSLFRIAGALF